MNKMVSEHSIDYQCRSSELTSKIDTFLSVVEISFDKVVGRSFIDSMSLVTQEMPTMVQRNFSKLGLFRTLKIAISDSFKDFFKQCCSIKLVTGESGFMVKCARKTFLSLCCLYGILLCNKNYNFYVCNVLETLFETVEQGHMFEVSFEQA